MYNYGTVPHSFVLSRGDVGRYCRRLVRDLKLVFAPYTATDLVVSKIGII